MITYENTRTLYDLVKKTGAEHAGRTFLRYENSGSVFDVTYDEFALECDGIMAWALEQSEKLGHKIKVGLLGSSSHQYFVMLLGIMAAGCVSVPLDIQVDVETLADCVNRADIDVLFYDWIHAPLVDGILSKCKNLSGTYSLQHGYHVPCFDNVMSEYIGRSAEPEVSEDDLAMILFTSGTTGRGKGVMLSQRNLIDNVFCTTDSNHPENEIYLNILPIHHVFCINGDVLIVMRYGSTLCLNRNMAQLAAHIQLFQPTVIRMVPMVAKALYNRIALLTRQDPGRSIHEIKKEVLGKHLYKIVSGGGYLQPELAENFRNIGVSIMQGYGMSECSPKVAAPDWNRPDKVASVGRVVDRCQVRIVDEEIQVKSPSVMMGYYGEPDKTAEAMTEDGWLKTGDIGYVDEEGFLWLTGRKKNLIILSNGENVAPEQLENMFVDDNLVEEILCYGEDDVITAEIYPNFKYAQAAGVEDVQAVINQIVAKHNESLPSFKRIMRVRFRDIPFEKTSSKKIKRSQYFSKKAKDEETLVNSKKPQTELQEIIYDGISAVLGHKRFGVDTDFYEAGLDSMGSVLFLSDMHVRLKKEITLADLMNHASVEKLEAFILEEHEMPEIDYSKRDVYPLTSLQMYFAYVMRGNTTANLPFFYKLDPSVDLERLSTAIGDLFDVHPELKDVIQPSETGYLANFRQDELRVEIPVTVMTDEEFEEARKTFLVPFTYTPGEPLYHIGIYKTDTASYLFFDIAHIMGDGMTMNVLFEDLNRLYAGEKLPQETYTFYEYIIDEKEREKNGAKAKYIEYYQKLMEGFRIRKSILNHKDSYDLQAGINGTIRKYLTSINRNNLTAFCRSIGVSENVMFLTAFNYCIGIFSNESDTLSSSIHSGRTDSRWNRIAGPLFLTYMFRYATKPHEKVAELLKRNARQVMETMQCHMSTLHGDEMFFQYQGDILNIPQIGGAPAERQRMQLDSLPFHLQVMSDEKGYYYELRFWENRFDREQLEIFMICYESILNAMMKETSVRRLKQYLPETLFPWFYYTTVGKLNAEAETELVSGLRDAERLKVFVLNKECRKQPFGAWGDLYVMDHATNGCVDKITNPYDEKTVLYRTGKTARILPDGSLEILDQAGRMVMQESVRGRNFLDLQKLEDVLTGYHGIEQAEAYVRYNSDNQLLLCAELVSDQVLDEEELKNYIRESAGELLVPGEISYKNK